MRYADLVSVYQALESTSKRLEKTSVLSKFLQRSDVNGQMMLLLQGRVFPNWDQRELGMASKLIIKAINLASGLPLEKIESLWKEKGDLGVVASELIGRKTQSTLFSADLTVQKVFDNLRKISELEGEGTVDKKVQLISELLTSSKGDEAKYIVRTTLGELRIGLGDGTIRDAIVWANFGEKIGVKYDSATNDFDITDEQRKIYDGYCEKVQESIDILNDFAEVLDLIKSKGELVFESLSLQAGKPVKVMLFQKAKSIKDGLDAVGRPCAVEYKYDGFRLQIHKKDGKIKLFTRRLENVTEQFPDVVSEVKARMDGNEFIVDAEAVGIDRKTGRYVPFQDISQRIKRKYDIAQLAKEFPMEVLLFDVLFAGNESLLKNPFKKRRDILSKMVRESPLLKLSRQCVTGSDSEAEEFYRECLSLGNEGVMMKNLESPYKPGSRVGFGVKVKPTMDTLEVVIVGAELGEGKRGKWLASFIVAVRDVQNNSFVEIGRVGTGIKEKSEEGLSFEQLTDMLTPLIIEEKGREVKVHPKIVIEVDYEEIQKSPTYSSGFALRFPRLVRLRDDRDASDISTTDDVRALSDNQRGRNS